MKHPKIGDGVILLANSAIYGESILGNNVIVSQGSVIVDEDIPDNCIVIGQSPNLRALPNKNNNLSIFNI
jgi:serine O-acetyltransferase